MVMKKDRKSYPCVPGSSFIPCLFIFGVFFWLGNAYYFSKKQPGAAIGMVLFAIVTLVFTIWCWNKTMYKVEIHSDHVICKGFLCKDVVIDYEKATIGMDYHMQRGCKVWWIYLCYGPGPVFDPRKPYNRMNSLKCRQGFIRIMFQEDIYDELMAVLPKKQKTALTTARRCTKI